MRFILFFLLLVSFSLEGIENSPATLYFHPRSSCSWRIKLALDYKGIPYEIITTDVREESDEYRQINPMKKVPSLTIDGKTLSQTVAILEYLEETKPEYPPLLPNAPYERSLVRQIVQIVASDIQPLQNGGVLRELESAKPWAQYWINRGFVGLEEMLKDTAGTYAVGDTITMADVFLLPQFRNARKYEVNLEPFPTIRKLEKTLEALDAFHVPL